MSKTFVADAVGPPRRRFWIYHSGIVGQPEQGWCFVYDDHDDEHGWRTGWDTFEVYFYEILRYPPEYAKGPLTWRDEETGETVDLPAMQAQFDGFPSPDRTAC
ncbi:MAG TPA: hypothetical protein VHW05_13515 [Phenylobacterium sp.]|nr:hypothetical protein [Phenylobacterium sp.]